VVSPEAVPEEALVVLVVGDNADMRAYIRACLEGTFTVVEAENGAEGVERAREWVPDLVLSDVMMPEMDGLELCATLKADERTSHIPTVLLTAKAAVEHRIAGYALGADAYLPKPFDAGELVVRVEALIRERRRLRALFAGQASGDGSPTEPGEAGLPARELAFLARIEAVIEERLADAQFGVEAMAEAMAMSPRQLLRKLRALTDETTAGLIRRKRLERAAHLLREEGFSVEATTEAVGFLSETSFARTFREHYGVPPSEYARQPGS
jgi:CheY-like chemotaxis protein